MQIRETLLEKPEGHSALVVGSVEIYLPLSSMVDLEEEHRRLSSDLADTEAQIKRLEALLASPFAEKAPADIVQKERERLAGFRETAEKIRTQLQASR
jgi:valyl-tRNA synthetase